MSLSEPLQADEVPTRAMLTWYQLRSAPACAPFDFGTCTVVVSDPDPDPDPDIVIQSPTGEQR